MTIFDHCLANVGTMLATGCYANLGATSAQAKFADFYFKTTSGHGRAKVGSTSGQCWQHVGNRWSRQSRRDLGPTYVSRLLLIDEARANVGNMSATGGHANYGATSAQPTLADTYSMTTFDQCLANVGTMLATGCYANLGATSAQAKFADFYFKTTSGHGRAKVGSTLAVCRQPVVTPITARPWPNVR
ncbi:hypothetical protein ALC57_13595 [Trachymyrmex cornetzi]|uniref:Uncharacterized protein n=1 Tax=Trachymyrmex cornetzi TaxID=471704 RepID=A0A151IZ88_9HYME|nr:hypothetical protein ALC57_13595 [Trachymyrmex cornetzi]